jgi:beta-glucanase (GH16 family)
MIRRLTILALLGLCTIVPVQAMGMASAELYGTKAYTYGRFEARIQHAPGDGVVSSFFLWKEGSELSGAYWNEIDFEKVGANCIMQTNARYGTSVSNHEQKNPMPGNTCAEYHDYRIEWTPTYIAWSVDGSEFRRDTGDTATAFSQNASAGMTMHFNIWPGNSSFGGNINNTTLPVREYISWVQYSSYDNGNFQVQWRAEFQDSTIPTGWAVGNWGSAYNLSTHSPQNVSFVDGIAVLSLTADNATGNPGTTPVDDGTSGTSNSGGGAGNPAGSTGGSSGGGSSGGCAMMSFSQKDRPGLVCILMVGACLLVLGRTRRR